MRIENTSRQFGHRELILASRKAVIEQTNDIKQINSIWMQIASLALDAKIHSAVWYALCKVQENEGFSQVVRARLYDDLGYTTNSINILYSEVVYECVLGSDKIDK